MIFVIGDEAWSSPQAAKTPSLEQVMEAVGFDSLLANCVEFRSKLEVVENTQHPQTNSEQARSYLGANVAAPDSHIETVYP